MKQLLSFALVLFTSVSVFAQESIIEKEKFDTAHQNGLGRYGGKPHRTIEVAEYYEGGTKPNKSSKSVIEIHPTGSRHAIFDIDQTVVRLRYESIRIRGMVYTRSENAPWKEVTSSEVKRETKPIPQKRSSVAEQQIEYRFLGNQKLNNEDTSVFQKFQNSRILDSLDNSEMLISITTTCWYGKDGRILKQEVKTESSPSIKNQSNFADLILKEKEIRSIRTMIWELDPNLKIEAPVIN